MAGGWRIVADTDEVGVEVAAAAGTDARSGAADAGGAVAVFAAVRLGGAGVGRLGVTRGVGTSDHVALGDAEVALPADLGGVLGAGTGFQILRGWFAGHVISPILERPVC